MIDRKSNNINKNLNKKSLVKDESQSHRKAADIHIFIPKPEDDKYQYNYVLSEQYSKKGKKNGSKSASGKGSSDGISKGKSGEADSSKGGKDSVSKSASDKGSSSKRKGGKGSSAGKASKKSPHMVHSNIFINDVYYIHPISSFIPVSSNTVEESDSSISSVFTIQASSTTSSEKKEEQQQYYPTRFPTTATPLMAPVTHIELIPSTEMDETNEIAAKKNEAMIMENIKDDIEEITEKEIIEKESTTIEKESITIAPTINITEKEANEKESMIKVPTVNILDEETKEKMITEKGKAKVKDDKAILSKDADKTAKEEKTMKEVKSKGMGISDEAYKELKTDELKQPDAKESIDKTFKAIKVVKEIKGLDDDKATKELKSIAPSISKSKEVKGDKELENKEVKVDKEIKEWKSIAPSISKSKEVKSDKEPEMKEVKVDKEIKESKSIAPSITKSKEVKGDKELEIIVKVDKEIKESGSIAPSISKSKEVKGDKELEIKEVKVDKEIKKSKSIAPSISKSKEVKGDKEVELKEVKIDQEFQADENKATKEYKESKSISPSNSKDVKITDSKNEKAPIDLKSSKEDSIAPSLATSYLSDTLPPLNDSTIKEEKIKEKADGKSTKIDTEPQPPSTLTASPTITKALTTPMITDESEVSTISPTPIQSYRYPLTMKIDKQNEESNIFSEEDRAINDKQTKVNIIPPKLGPSIVIMPTSPPIFLQPSLLQKDEKEKNEQASKLEPSPIYTSQSSKPTNTPSKVLTNKPSKRPTQKPTKTSSKKPTQKPTIEPTVALPPIIIQQQNEDTNIATIVNITKQNEGCEEYYNGEIIKTNLEINVQYIYELYYNSTLDIQDVLNDFENTLMHTIAPEILQCNNNTEIAIVSKEKHRSLISRYGIISLSSTPEDEVIKTDEDCITSLENIADAECKTINGKLTAYLKEGYVYSREDQAREEVLTYINEGMKNGLFVDNKTTYQTTYLGSPLNDGTETPEGGMPASKIIDGIYSSTDNKLTGVGITFIVFSVLGVLSIALLLVRKRKRRRAATMEKLDDNSFIDEDKIDDDFKALSFASTMDEDDAKLKKNVKKVNDPYPSIEEDNDDQMILNKVTSLTQDSEEEDESKPASIISQRSNNIVFHRLPSQKEKMSFLSNTASYKKPSMMQSKNNITFSKNNDGTYVSKVNDDDPIFVSVNSPPFKGSYEKGRASLVNSNKRDYRANDSVVL